MHIETPRMTIRNFTPKDAPDLYEIFGDEETMENCEPAYDLGKTQSFLSSFCIARKGAVAAVHRKTNKMIGYILFNEYEEDVYGQVEKGRFPQPLAFSEKMRKNGMNL